MKQRIRYVKKDNKLISKNQIFSKHGSKYMVFIDLETRTYIIRNMVSHRKYEGGENINNMNVLKRTIKAHLEHLGCIFEKEKRFRTFGLCNKGHSQIKEIELRREKKLMEQKSAPINNDGAN
jgi:hypothetical protein